MKKLIARLKELLLHNRSTKQIVAKNVFWLSFGQISSRGLRAIIIIYAARVLGTETYGVFSYALGLAGFFTIFADIGINPILTREAAQKPEQAKEYFATSFIIKVLLLTGTALLVIFVAPFFSKIEAAKALIPLVALLVIFDNVRELCNSFFRAKDKMEWEALVTILTNVSIVISGFIILYFSKTAYGITATYIASAGTGMLVAVMLLKRNFMSIPSTFNKMLMKPIMRSAWPIAFSSLIGAFMINVDVIMLGRMRSAAEIGLYAAGQRIVQVLYLLPAIFASALYPTLSRLAKNEESEHESSIIEKSMALTFMIAAPIVMGGIILGKPIIALLFGNDYLAGTLSFQILITTLITIFPTAFLSNLLIAHNKQKKVLVPTATASISNIIGNALLIPYLGIAGAAITTIAVQVIYTGILWRISQNIKQFHVIHRIKKTVIATVMMGVCAAIFQTLHMPVLINIILSGALYATFLLMIKEPLAKEALSIISKTLMLKTPLQQ